MTSELLYGRRPVREAIRGPREVLELWATERALKAEPWLRDSSARVHVKAERELTAEAGTQDHQGVVARVESFRYADAHALAAGEAPLLAVIASVTDPRHLGAGIPRAEGAGAGGAVLRGHAGSGRGRPRAAGAQLGARDAGGCPRVSRSGGASPGRGRQEPGALPRRDQGAAPLDLGRRERGGNDDVAGRPLRRRGVRARRRGQGPQAARPPDVR